MPNPLAICIEDLEARPGEPRYVRCVAIPGRQPGLRLDTGGEVLWKTDDDVACELWVSADDRLILYRPEGADAVTVSRAGRSLDVPFGKPVVLIDQDGIAVGGRQLRVHVHGEAPAVSAPSVLAPQQGALSGLARAAAVAATISAAAVAGGCGDKIDVRDQPPAVAAPEELRKKPTGEEPAEEKPTEEEPAEEEPAEGKPAEETKAPEGAVAPEPKKETKIEVRENPPDMEVEGE